MRSNLTDTICELLGKEFPLLRGLALSPSMPLLSSGLLDSFAIITLVSALEKTLKISIDVEQLDAAQFETPATIAALCQSRLP